MLVCINFIFEIICLNSIINKLSKQVIFMLEFLNCAFKINLQFKTAFELIWGWKIENKEKQKKKNKSPGPWSLFLAHLGRPRQPNPHRQPPARAHLPLAR